jgi:hypothetical protein
MTRFQRLFGLILVNAVLTMMAHANAASADWQAKKAQFEQKFEAACGADADKLCAGVKGMRAIHKCMREHKTELSANCTAFNDEMKAKWKAHHADKQQ